MTSESFNTLYIDDKVLISYYLSRTYENLGMTDKANEIITMIESLHKDQPTDLNSLIIYLERLFLLNKERKFEVQTDLIQNTKELIARLEVTRDTKRWLGLFNYILGNHVMDKGQYDLAEQYFLISVQFLTESKDQRDLAFTFNSLARAYQLKGEIEQALDNFLKALKIYQKFGFEDQVLKLYNNVGVCYLYKGLLDLALDFFTKALDYYMAKNKFDNLGAIYNNIGIVYSSKGELENALQYYHRALEFYLEGNNESDIALGYMNIGETFLQKDQINMAEGYFNKSLSIFEKLNNPISLAEIYFDLLRLAVQENNTKKASSYLNKMKEINTTNITENISLKIKISEALLLQESSKTSDLEKAKELFLNIINSPIIDHEIYLSALLNYSNLLINEFKTSLDRKILAEINDKIQLLIQIANDNFIYGILIESYILASKVAFIEGNFEYADQLLAEGIKTAHEKSLTGLLVKIEKYREQSTQEYKHSSSSMKERLEHSLLADYVKRIKRIFG